MARWQQILAWAQVYLDHALKLEAADLKEQQEVRMSKKTIVRYLEVLQCLFSYDKHKCVYASMQIVCHKSAMIVGFMNDVLCIPV
jgi:hypothetical protein